MKDSLITCFPIDSFRYRSWCQFLIISSKIRVVKAHFKQEVNSKSTPSLDKAQMKLTLDLRWRGLNCIVFIRMGI